MGVCPQFDVLWPELSGREHLLLYGRIKGHKTWKGIREEADALLDKVSSCSTQQRRSGLW
jgi:ATP-binding cassette subfamily A (ABC1) protein 1/ATP-binding cassette subfamily A (ABC1) protein 3